MAFIAVTSMAAISALVLALEAINAASLSLAKSKSCFFSLLIDAVSSTIVLSFALASSALMARALEAAVAATIVAAINDEGGTGIVVIFDGDGI